MLYSMRKVLTQRPSNFRGSHLVLINKSETRADARAELVIREPIGDVLHAALPEE